MQRLLIEHKNEDGTTTIGFWYLNAHCGNSGIEVNKDANAHLRSPLPDWHFDWDEIVSILEVDEDFILSA